MEQQTTAANYYIEELALIELKGADEAPPELKLTVRKAKDDPASFATLKASLLAVGVLVPLIVIWHEGTPYVIAGNRRLKALRELYANDTPSDLNRSNYFVPTVNGDRYDQPSEIALMANIALPMHPVDRYEVLASLAGQTDIAARWGLSEKQIKQTLALGRLSPRVRDAWRNGEIDAKAAEAFTLTDPTAQDQILTRILKDGDAYKREGNFIRREIIGDQNDTHRLLTFVGQDNYEAAGGTIVTDLFGTDYRVSDRALLKKLSDEKIAQECARLIADGWSFAAVTPPDSYNYGKSEPARLKTTPEQREERDRLKAAMKAWDDRDPLPDDEEDADDLAEDLDVLDRAIKVNSFSEEQRAKAGVFLRINDRGILVFDPGRIQPVKKQSERDEETGKKKRGRPSAKPSEGAEAISLSLANRLSIALTQALTIAATPRKADLNEAKVGLAALLAGLRSGGDICIVKSTGLLEKKHPATKLASFDQAFAEAMDLSVASICTLLATWAAKSFDAEDLSSKNRGLVALCNGLAPDRLAAALHERFDAADYFANVSKAVMVQMARDIGASNGQIESLDKMKKAQAVETAIDLATEAAWLPPQLLPVSLKAKPKGKGGVRPKRR